MFEKFRLKKLSKVVQSVISNLFEQIAKKDYFGTFSKINFLNIENVALLYKKNKNIVISKSDVFLKALDKYISNSGIDLSFLENVDLKKLVEKFERLCANGYKNFIENDIRDKIIERIKKILTNFKEENVIYKPKFKNFEEIIQFLLLKKDKINYTIIYLKKLDFEDPLIKEILKMNDIQIYLEEIPDDSIREIEIHISSKEDKFC